MIGHFFIVCIAFVSLAQGDKVNDILDKLATVLVDPKLKGAIRPDYDELYNEFKKEHSQEQEKFGLHPSQSRFRENVAEVLENNVKYLKHKVPYKMKVTKMSDIPMDELRKRYESVLYMNESTLANYTYQPAISSKLKGNNNFDWRDYGYVTEVKDQGRCGSCYAFATAVSLETQLWIHQGYPTLLSEQQLVDCSISRSGCEGAYLGNTVRYTVEKGLMKATDYPYTMEFGNCKYRRGSVVAKAHKIYNVPVGDEQALIDAIQMGPVVIGMKVNSNFFSYQSGIFTDDSCEPRPNHAMAVVGFGSKNGKDYYIVKNSWGSWFGDEGYINVEKKTAERCGILTMAFVPML